jgi:hypothetical protein
MSQDPDLSLYGWRSLMADVFRQALREFYRPPDILTQLDAAYWLASDGAWYLQALGVDVNVFVLFGKKQPKRILRKIEKE